VVDSRRPSVILPFQAASQRTATEQKSTGISANRGGRARSEPQNTGKNGRIGEDLLFFPGFLVIEG
jgi:hypothetical protein